MAIMSGICIPTTQQTTQRESPSPFIIVGDGTFTLMWSMIVVCDTRAYRRQNVSMRNESAMTTQLDRAMNHGKSTMTTYSFH